MAVKQWQIRGIHWSVLKLCLQRWFKTLQNNQIVPHTLTKKKEKYNSPIPVKKINNKMLAINRILIHLTIKIALFIQKTWNVKLLLLANKAGEMPRNGHIMLISKIKIMFQNMEFSQT